MHAVAEMLFNNKIYCFDEDDILYQCENDDEFREVKELFYAMEPIVKKFYEDSKANLLPIKQELVIGDP